MKGCVRLVVPAVCLLLASACCGEDKFKLRGQEPAELDQDEIPEWLTTTKKPPPAPDPEFKGTYGIEGSNHGSAMDEQPPDAGSAASEEGGVEAASDEAVATGATVKGSLSKEVIRRIIKKHINQVQFCHENQLVKQPKLSGTISVQFVISPQGSVQTAKIASSTLDSEATEKCVVKAVKTWMFPKPEGGGVVVVTYPFTFTTSD